MKVGEAEFEIMGRVKPNSDRSNRNETIIINKRKTNAVFNTDKNHSVIQTYNLTTYKRCDYNNADADDTVVWSAGQPVVAVPLLKEGMTYFFSGNYDGKQCKHGQHFKIKVLHGLGLPQALKTLYASPAPKASPRPISGGGDQSVPDTVMSMPSNSVDPTAAAESSGVGRFGGLSLVVVVVVVGLVCVAG
ncbi:hypothetical protein QJS04_geneDACA003608 [Acorus gramineus]|uniref:Phytocyanin domain-containing protein n=1 Tax=Acorus gramineus TaxID=55184 RepID=A0AAV9BR27_ACOGR|nr:hypothetical protein QJS04_geneDACA003608 [Acorus gramineus]